MQNVDNSSQMNIIILVIIHVILPLLLLLLQLSFTVAQIRSASGAIAGTLSSPQTIKGRKFMLCMNIVVIFFTIKHVAYSKCFQYFAFIMLLYSALVFMEKTTMCFGNPGVSFVKNLDIVSISVVTQDVKLKLGQVVMYQNRSPCHFLAHLSMECSMSYCDHSPSVVVRPSDVQLSVRPSTICLLTLYKY